MKYAFAVLAFFVIFTILLVYSRRGHSYVIERYDGKDGTIIVSSKYGSDKVESMYLQGHVLKNVVVKRLNDGTVIFGKDQSDNVCNVNISKGSYSMTIFKAGNSWEDAYFKLGYSRGANENVCDYDFYFNNALINLKGGVNEAIKCFPGIKFVRKVHHK
jgi:hypothetical protein